MFHLIELDKPNSFQILKVYEYNSQNWLCLNNRRIHEIDFLDI